MDNITMTSMAKAEVLIEALPYMRSYTGRYFVIKYGGQAMISPDLMKAVVQDLVLMKYIGIKPVLVHGGGKEVNQVMAMLGKSPKFVNGLRVTDDETMDIVEMVLMGKVNKHIVNLINRQGARAVGLSGRDADILLARKKDKITPSDDPSGEMIDLGRVGDIIQVNPDLIHTVSDKGYIPVISSIGTGLDGESLNINADYVAGEMAISLKAEKLIFLTDVNGIYRKRGDKTEFISSINRRQIREMLSRGEISGGMIPKVESCLMALDGGIQRTHIIDGCTPHALILEVFSATGVGTTVTR